jgi:hypothetical protein
VLWGGGLEGWVVRIVPAVYLRWVCEERVGRLVSK